MLELTHQFFVVIRDEGGREIVRKVVETLQPVYENLLFSAVLGGHMPNDGVSRPARIEPEFREGKLQGLHATLGSFEKSYSLDLFRDRALELLTSKDLVERHGDGSLLSWDVVAEVQERTKPKRRISVSREPFPFASSTLESLSLDPSPDGVFVSSELLQELKAETASSLERERADALTGRLVVDANQRAAVVITGRIPFPDSADASATHYAFTPEAFKEVQREHQRRDDDQSLAGWHHNHPPPCGRDCLAHVPACKTATVFLSADDRAVFRASFAAPYHVGLVSGKGSERRPEDPVVRAYGWRDAVLEELNYVVC